MRARVGVMLLSVVMGTSGGFASGMASEGYDPGKTWLRSGVSRVDIERELGPAITTSRLSDGRVVAVYEYGRSVPNRHLGAMHGFLGTVPFGMWEIVGVPMEKGRAAHGEKVWATVTYGEDGRLVNVE